MNKIIFFIACLSILCGFGDSVNIECNYGPFSWTVYQCSLGNTLNITSRELAVIDSNTGDHDGGKSNADLTCFFSAGSSHVIEYFPRNLENIFTNLKIIYIIHGRLKEIHQNDLSPFPNLTQLSLSYNAIEYLDDGLFAYNPELAHIHFAYNKIIHIGTRVFENLNKLTWLNLSNNTCINMYASYNKTAVREIIGQAKSKCQAIN